MIHDQFDEVIDDFAARGALFVVNHSGGKDSMALFLKVSERVRREQILVVHAHLPEVEWEGTAEKARQYTRDAGFAYREVTAVKTFFEMVEHRQMWPSPANRQCTSDLKRGPIEKVVRHYLKEHPEFGGLVVNCMGIRADESSARAKANPLKHDVRNSKAGREWWQLLPIHDWTIDDVWAAIAEAGQERHWAYDAGMTRLSCTFCIMASKADLTTAARLNPELYRRYVETERRLNFTFAMPDNGIRKFLPELTGIA